MLLSQKENIAWRDPGAAAPGPPISSLQDFDIFRLQSLRALRHLELYRLPFLKTAEAVRLNGREMHENVLAILPRYEAETLGIVKPLHCSLLHWVVPFFPFSGDSAGRFCWD